MALPQPIPPEKIDVTRTVSGRSKLVSPGCSN